MLTDPHVRLGIESLIASGLIDGRRIGLVCTAASVDHDLRHSADILSSAPNVTLAALFGPQHGIGADAQDNMIETPHATDPATHRPIYSLYSETRTPTADMLAGLDVLVVDLPDVGTRVYTYAWTLANCLRACRAQGLRVVVADRPNPIGGEQVEGPVLDPRFASFVGQFAVPLRHGLTMGELARLFNEHFEIGADLDLVPMTGWERSMFYDQTGLPWVLPSPNLPTLDSTLVYPGMVLIEGTTLSEGRGTTRPFELIGAPWLDGRALAARLDAADLPGAHFRPAAFQPTFHKHAGETCHGCQIHVVDRSRFRPVLTAVSLLQECYRAAPHRFAWRDPPYEYELTRTPIDLLAGSDALRRQIEADVPATEIANGWEAPLQDFLEARRRVLLYG